MSDLEDDNRIKVYCTVTGLTESTICEILRSDVLGTISEVKEQFTIEFVLGQRPLLLVEHQLKRYKVPAYSEQSYFLIVDSVNAATDGVLLCDVEADHGFPDAVRSMPDMAGMTAASLGVANSNWTEVREGTWHEQQPPVPPLAIYDNRKNGDRASFHQFADGVDVGLHYVNDEEPPPSQSSINDLFRYIAISLEKAINLDKLVEEHQHAAEETGFDPNRFAVIDDKFATDGALLVQVKPRKEVRCKLPVAGELLYWNAIGFMNWAEMEVFAFKHTNFEDKLAEQRIRALPSLCLADSGNPEIEESEPSDDRRPKEQFQRVHDIEGDEDFIERKFRYYRTKLGFVIASLDSYELHSTFFRPRQKSDGADQSGEIGSIEDSIIEELPWDYYLKGGADMEEGA